MPVPSSLSLKPDSEKAAKDSPSQPADTSHTPPESPNSGPSEDVNHNKLFVGALNPDTKQETLKSFFSEFGELLECDLRVDGGNRKSRGFAFIRFKEPESIQKVLKSHAKEPLKIDDKIIDPKLALPKHENKVRRIFIGGLSSETTVEDMEDYFAAYGKVEEAQLMYDKNTNRHRGFGFVTFEKHEPAEKVCGIQFHDVKGKKVEVKVAQTKEALAQQAGKAARSPAYNQGYANTGTMNYSPTYPPFYPSPPYPIELYGHQFMSTPQASKPRNNGMGNSPNKMRIANQYSPPAYFGGYNYSPADPHMTSQFFSGFGGLPSPFFTMRGHPSLPLNSPPVDYIDQSFQAMAIMGHSPYPGISPSSPPNNMPLSLNGSSFGYQNSDSVGANYSPPNRTSPKEGSPSGTPITGGYSQVPNSFTSGKNSFPIQQQATA